MTRKEVKEVGTEQEEAQQNKDIRLNMNSFNLRKSPNQKKISYLIINARR